MQTPSALPLASGPDARAGSWATAPRKNCLNGSSILLTMYQSRPQLCKSVQQSVREVYGDDLHVFERPIEYTIRIAECPMAGMSILDYEPGNPAAESYRNLASEVLRLG